MILVAPTAAGSWRLEVLPVLVMLSTLGLAALAVHLWGEQRPFHVSGLVMGLVALAVLTMLQAVPLGQSTLGAISPVASEVRGFITGRAAGPISYEPAATWREAAKLLIYASVAAIAHTRVRERRATDLVSLPVIGAGLLVTAIGLLHSVLGIDRLFGLIETRLVDQPMVTTFINPNHAAGFMSFAALTALGVGLSERPRHIRVGALMAALCFVATSMWLLSRGGMLGLAVGLAVFTAFYARVERGRAGGSQRIIGALCAIGAVVLVIGFWLGADRLGTEMLTVDGSVPGLDEKLSAMKDAVPLAEDHWLTGIGRGAYVSVYARYKTSPLQLTFAFPENIVVQLLSEWGVIGALSLLGLLYALVRRLLAANHLSTLGALCGVAALFSQNLVDFSLEMPGVAIPAVAVLGAATSRQLRTHAVRPRAAWVWAAGVAAMVTASIGTLALAFGGGDLPSDLERLDEWIGERRAAPMAPIAAGELDEIAARHPASALVTTRIAYLEEVSAPPDLASAVRWVNRTMYLAPTDAGAHFMTGRLLIKAGRRQQGFSELKQAWSLWNADRTVLLGHILELARSPEELLWSVPKVDEALQEPSTDELIRLARRALEEGRGDWGKALIERHGPLEKMSPADLASLSIAASQFGDVDLALSASERRAALVPDDPQTVLLRVRLLVAKRDLQAAWAVLAQAPEGTMDKETLLRTRFDLAVMLQDYPLARESLEQLRSALPTTRRNQVALAQLEARVEAADGHFALAVRQLDEALAIEPSNTEIRFRRAVLLQRLGRVSEAMVDANLVVRQRPEHVGGQRLLNVLRGRESPTAPPEGLEP